MITINEIRQLIANDENRTLKLKKSTSELVKGMQTLYVFLNTDGGWLIFGVTPKLGKSQNIEFAHLKTVWKRD